jgi:hypothetical protein
MNHATPPGSWRVVDLGVAFAEPFLEVAVGNANGWVATCRAVMRADRWVQPSCSIAGVSAVSG